MEKLLINTPQNVRIEYPLASVGTRFLALAIDYALIVCYAYLTFYLFRSFFNVNGDRWLMTGIIMLWLLPAMLYHFILESFFSGQTLGKMVMKIKVVRIDGSRATIYEYFIRWVLNLVDIWMLSGVIGLLSIVLSKHSQRIGDMAAGTTVISLKPRIELSQTVYEKLADTYEPVFPEYVVGKLSDKDVNIIKESLANARKGKNVVVMARLAEKIRKVTAAQQGEYGDLQFIELILKDHYHYFNGA